MEVKAVEAKGDVTADNSDAAMVDTAPDIYTGFGVSDDTTDDHDKFSHAHFVDDPGNALSFVSALDYCGCEQANGRRC